jgi:YD repeat-containing protein
LPGGIALHTRHLPCLKPRRPTLPASFASACDRAIEEARHRSERRIVNVPMLSSAVRCVGIRRVDGCADLQSSWQIWISQDALPNETRSATPLLMTASARSRSYPTFTISVRRNNSARDLWERSSCRCECRRVSRRTKGRMCSVTRSARIWRGVARRPKRFWSWRSIGTWPRPNATCSCRPRRSTRPLRCWSRRGKGTLQGHGVDREHVWVALPPGGREVFSQPHAQGTFTAHWNSRATLVRVTDSPIRYERRLSDGSIEVFTVSDGAPVGQRRVFMSALIDPLGQTLSLTWDAQARLVAISDALGQVTTIAYEHPSDSLKITKITDPFGCFVTFTYNAAGQLASITDVVGTASSFSYGQNDFVSTLRTPYGDRVSALGSHPDGWPRCSRGDATLRAFSECAICLNPSPFAYRSASRRRLYGPDRRRERSTTAPQFY